MTSPARSCLAAAGVLAAIANFNSLSAQTMVGTEAALQTAINNDDANIELTNNLVLTTPITVGATTTLANPIVINGNGNSITSPTEVFFVQSGNVTISNTTLTGTATGGNGGAGQNTGAGALGAGGAIFVGAAASVTASNVQFSNNSATGGSAPAVTGSGFGGGGGMNGGTGGNADTNGGGGGGGNGGAGGFGTGGTGGGGGGLNSAGGDAANNTGGNGGGPNGGAGSNSSADGGAGGANSGGGGGASNSNSTNGGNGGTNGGGGGGGIGANSGNGGDYAGGGGADGNGGNGGFGGGGGAGYPHGGAGGFGAGGGGSVNSGGTAGVGGGNGGTGTSFEQGGGGAGLGGAVFVQAGGSFIVTGNQTFSGNSTTAGTGSNPGAAAGSDLFVMTGAGATLAPGTGDTITITGTIADDSIASLPNFSGFNPGTGAGAALVIGASGSAGGTVALNSDNTYSGGTDVGFNTTLAVGSAGALGSGLVSVSGGTLTVGNGNHNIVVGSYTQGGGGTLLLNVTGSGAGAAADRLIITNSTANQAALGGTLKINFAGFTEPTNAPATFDLTVVQTDSSYTGTFAALDALNLPHNATASVIYTDPVNVQLQISLAAVAIAAAGLTPNEQAPLGAINTALAKGVVNPALAGLSHALLQLSGPSAIGGAAAQLSPLKFNNFASVTADNNEVFEVQSEDTYLAGERVGPNGTFIGGNGQLDASGLTINDPNIDPGLQLIHSRMLAWNEPAAAVSDVPGALLGGVDMKACNSCGAADNDPWNVFVRGNVVLAQGFSQTDQPHFDDNSESVVLGADYRFTPHVLIGLTAGYAHTDATLDTSNSSATVDSYSPGLYASYADKGWYANLIGRYSHNSYTEDRVIGVIGQTATGATDGNEGTADLDGGYDFHVGSWTLGPLAGAQYTHLTVNGYTEGESVASLAVAEDQSDSLRSRLGGSVKYDFRGGGVTFSPHLTASWQHEFLDASRGITSQFTAFNSGSFVVRTQNPSDDSALVDLGLDADIHHGITIFGDYLLQAGKSNYFGQSVEAGVRVNF